MNRVTYLFYYLHIRIEQGTEFTLLSSPLLVIINVLSVCQLMSRSLCHVWICFVFLNRGKICVCPYHQFTTFLWFFLYINTITIKCLWFQTGAQCMMGTTSLQQLVTCSPWIWGTVYPSTSTPTPSASSPASTSRSALSLKHMSVRLLRAAALWCDTTAMPQVSWCQCCCGLPQYFAHTSDSAQVTASGQCKWTLTNNLTLIILALSHHHSDHLGCDIHGGVYSTKIYTWRFIFRGGFSPIQFSYQYK